MNILRQQSPSFQMQVKGLDDRYFSAVPKKLKSDLLLKAQMADKANFTVEFVPTKDNWVFLRKIKEGVSSIVDYFPNQYTPVDIIKTFTKTYIPEYRVMAKSLLNETNKMTAQKFFREHADI